MRSTLQRALQCWALNILWFTKVLHADLAWDNISAVRYNVTSTSLVYAAGYEVFHITTLNYKMCVCVCVVVDQTTFLFSFQLGLPLSSLCIVPCNTMFGSLHQMVGISFFFFNIEGNYTIQFKSLGSVRFFKMFLSIYLIKNNSKIIDFCF